MTHHEKSLTLIKSFCYNSRQVSEVLGLSYSSVRQKVGSVGYHKFTDDQFEKLLEHFEKVHTEQSELLKEMKSGYGL
ncbi:hypothetical protein SAMN05443429_11213 [Cruoricaptor ignavus]|uniref:Uncharacterized protein n=1 Tax=Cruoricaptor ignavus TaxID=1118202 RepID=A0A1M6HCF2_9FLAO|nr:hypothetical protein SAMN05443429_11213 [Cruoricaptor ignavus]